MTSVFSKIISHELPAYRVHEDELTISILALDQVNPGHVIVIPKIEVDHWFDVPTEVFLRVQTNAQRIAKAQVKVVGCPRVGTITAGFEVPHYHLHLIPAWSIPDLDFRRARRLPQDEMQGLCDQLIQALGAKV